MIFLFLFIYKFINLFLIILFKIYFNFNLPPVPPADLGYIDNITSNILLLS